MGSGTIQQGGFVAGAAIALFDVCKFNSAGSYPSVIPGAADTDRPLLVALAPVASGENVEKYQLLDGSITTVRAAAAINAAVDITISAAGAVKTAAAGDVICGQALEAASGTGSLIKALVYQGWLKA